MTPAAAENHDDVELLEKLPSNRPNEVGKSTELSGKIDNITTLSETPNTIMQEPPYNYGKDVEITGNQNSGIAINFSMESNDVGKTNISNSQDPEVPSIQEKKIMSADDMYLRMIFSMCIVALMFIIISIIFCLSDCLPAYSTPSETPSTSAPAVTFRNDPANPQVAMQIT
ncbi:unnamed protein product [Orchesella dallaii]|uniref:Uncharacterized protein n=1 Tax=Orchesella dallaii TaxID=48710 RepID=A0ABP1R452_9HEXA